MARGAVAAALARAARLGRGGPPGRFLGWWLVSSRYRCGGGVGVPRIRRGHGRLLVDGLLVRGLLVRRLLIAWLLIARLYVRGLYVHGLYVSGLYVSGL